MIEPPLDIINLVREAKSVVIATHVFPDGDALGSQLGLGIALEKMGKKVHLFSEEPVSYVLDFLPGCNHLNTFFPEEEYDCAILLDCGDKIRLGSGVELLTGHKNTITIDHHTKHQNFSDYNWVDEGRSSTGEMVYDLLKALDYKVTYQAAYCLYTAILTDTGSFKYENTSPHTMRVAADLVELGVSPPEVSGYLYDNFSINGLMLLQKVLASLSVNENATVADVCLTQQMLAETGAQPNDAELFVNFPRSIKSVKVAVIFKETKDNLVGVSMRAKGEVDVARVARSFGGGGHCNAAGFKMPDTTLAKVRDKVLIALAELV